MTTFILTKVCKVLVQLHMIYFNMKSFEKHRAVICKVRFTQNNNRAVKPSLFVDASSLQAVKPTLLRVKLGYKAEKMEKKIWWRRYAKKLEVPTRAMTKSFKSLQPPQMRVAACSRFPHLLLQWPPSAALPPVPAAHVVGC